MLQSCISVLIIFGASLRSAAEEDPLHTSGQQYLERLSLAMKDRAPCDVIIGVYHGRKWQAQIRLHVSRASSDSGGFLELDEHAQGKLDGHAFEETGRQLLGYAWQPIRFENTKTLDGMERSRAVATLDGSRWKGRVTTDKGIQEQEGSMAPGACWTPIHLPWLMTPAMDMVLTEMSPEAKVFQVTCSCAPHCARIGDVSIEWRRVRVGRDSSEYQMFVDEHGDVVEVRTFNNGVVRLRRILENEVGKDLEGPLDITESQEVVIRFLEAVERQDSGTIEELMDFEARFAADVSGWDLLPKEQRQQFVERYKKGVLEHLNRAGEKAKGLDCQPVAEFIASASLAIESGPRADVWAGQLHFSLNRREETAEVGRWVIEKVVPLTAGK